MSRNKKSLTREIFPDGKIRLSSTYGIKDVRNDTVYSVVVCKPRSEKYFVENVNGGYADDIAV